MLLLRKLPHFAETEIFLYGIGGFIKTHLAPEKSASFGLFAVSTLMHVSNY